MLCNMVEVYHGDTTQNTAIFILTTIRTSIPNYSVLYKMKSRLAFKISYQTI
jgi:hypothetical protein